MPVSTETCGDCSFCAVTSCSNRGTCDSAADACVCDVGYSGRACERIDALACAGPVSASGTCCGASGVLDANDECCSGAAPALAFDGSCCASGDLNACGVCGGPAAAVVAADGACCASGVLDAGGDCCASGAVDSLGVCDGYDASAVLRVDVALNLPADTTASDLASPTSTKRVALDAAVEAHVAQNLRPGSRAVSSVTVRQYTASSGSVRRLAARRLAGTQTAVVDVEPYGGSNTITRTEAAADLSAAPASSLVSVASVAGVTAVGTCGDGVCQVGERPVPAAGFGGCPADCTSPVVSCPSTAAGPCNGVGRCAATTSGAGVCLCSAAQGYAGAACEECAPGFIAGANATCARIEASEPYVVVSSGGSGAGLVAAGAVGGILVAAVIGFVAYKMYTKHRNAAKAPKPATSTVVHAPSPPPAGPMLAFQTPAMPSAGNDDEIVLPADLPPRAAPTDAVLPLPPADVDFDNDGLLDDDADDGPPTSALGARPASASTRPRSRDGWTSSGSTAPVAAGLMLRSSSSQPPNPTATTVEDAATAAAESVLSSGGSRHTLGSHPRSARTSSGSGTSGTRQVAPRTTQIEDMAMAAALDSVNDQHRPHTAAAALVMTSTFDVATITRPGSANLAQRPSSRGSSASNSVHRGSVTPASPLPGMPADDDVDNPGFF